MSTINENFQYLNIGLPEDILRRKTYGDFEGALRLIEQRLSCDVPEALKKCMIVERELIKRLPADYPYSKEEALSIIRADIPDFAEAEFDTMVDEGKIDWVYVNGSEHFFMRFYSTLIKVNAEFAKRANKNRGHIDGENSDEADAAKEGMLDRVVRIMKEKGKCGYNIRIKASVRVKDEAFVKGEKVCVHIPIPAAARQIKNIKLISFSDAPKHIAPEDALERTVYFEEVLQENHEFFVEYSYDNIVEYMNPDPAKVSAEQPNFFLEEKNPHIVFTPYIKELVRTLTEGTDNPLEKARRFYDFITLNVNYSYMRAYFGLENIAECCARNLKGDCGVQALLFITLCRCAGIPAKWQSGLCASPESVGAHDWAEFYVAPYGWIFADPSFGGGSKRAGNEERRKFYFGNLDPYRMIANREFQALLDPPKKHWRGDPYDNQTGEVEYESRALLYEEYERDQVLISCSELEF